MFNIFITEMSCHVYSATVAVQDSSSENKSLEFHFTLSMASGSEANCIQIKIATLKRSLLE